MFRVKEDYSLEYVSEDKQWKVEELTRYKEEEIKQFLDVTEVTVLNTATKLKLQDKLKIIRKERAVGIVILSFVFLLYCRISCN